MSMLADVALIQTDDSKTSPENDNSNQKRVEPRVSIVANTALFTATRLSMAWTKDKSIVIYEFSEKDKNKANK